MFPFSFSFLILFSFSLAPSKQRLPQFTGLCSSPARTLLCSDCRSLTPLFFSQCLIQTPTSLPPSPPFCFFCIPFFLCPHFSSNLTLISSRTVFAFCVFFLPTITDILVHRVPSHLKTIGVQGVIVLETTATPFL